MIYLRSYCRLAFTTRANDLMLVRITSLLPAWISEKHAKCNESTEGTTESDVPKRLRDRSLSSTSILFLCRSHSSFPQLYSSSAGTAALVTTPLRLRLGAVAAALNLWMSLACALGPWAWPTCISFPCFFLATLC